MEKEKKTKPSIAVNFDVYEVIIYRISVFLCIDAVINDSRWKKKKIHSSDYFFKVCSVRR